MSDFIPATLVPPGVSDQRSRDFVAALSGLLGQFRTSALLIQNPLTVDARLLPIMTVELGMSDFITPGLMEHHVRQLLVRAPEIHAMTGTIAGTRRALGALGISVDWVQWWQTDPPGPHDTHTVTAYVNEHLIEGEEALLSAATQYAVLRVIEATQRWSQEIAFLLGVGFRTSAALASAGQFVTATRPTMIAAWQMPEARIGTTCVFAALDALRPTAVAEWPYPAAGLTAGAGLSRIEFLSLTMEAA